MAPLPKGTSSKERRREGSPEEGGGGEEEEGEGEAPGERWGLGGLNGVAPPAAAGLLLGSGMVGVEAVGVGGWVGGVGWSGFVPCVCEMDRRMHALFFFSKTQGGCVEGRHVSRGSCVRQGRGGSSFVYGQHDAALGIEWGGVPHAHIWLGAAVEMGQVGKNAGGETPRLQK